MASAAAVGVTRENDGPNARAVSPTARVRHLPHRASDALSVVIASIASMPAGLEYVPLETLPWDEWGRMGDSYRGLTGPDYDDLIDEVAAVCLDAASAAVASLYGRDELRVPPELMR